MLELFQAEWCPHSHKVRERLTELCLDFVARQVPAEPEDRDRLSDLAGTDEIPVLVEDGTVIAGEEEILAFIDRRHDEREDAPVHRQKVAEKAHFET